MNSYNKKLIRHDLINTKHWVEKNGWKEIKKQLYIILKDNYNSKYSLLTSNLNYDAYYSVIRLSKLLSSDELIQLLKDFDKYFYKKNKNNKEMIGGNNVLLGGLNIGKFANKFKSSAATYAKKAQSHVAQQGQQLAQQAKQYAQEQGHQLAQQGQQYLQQQGQQLAQQAKQYAQEQGQQLAQQGQQYLQQQGQQLAQQAHQYVQQQGQQLAQQGQQLVQQGQQYLQNQANIAQQRIQNTLQQVGQKAQRVGNQFNQQAQMYLTPQNQQELNKTVATYMPQQYYNPSIIQQVPQSGYIQPPLPTIATTPAQQFPMTQPTEPHSDSGFLGSLFESAGDMGKKIVGL